MVICDIGIRDLCFGKKMTGEDTTKTPVKGAHQDYLGIEAKEIQ
jgi:hypothetical protein